MGLLKDGLFYCRKLCGKCKGEDIMNITREKIDEIFLSAAENNLLDITNQFLNVLDTNSNMQNNPLEREILAISIAQGNIMAALKEVCYKLLLEND